MVDAQTKMKALVGARLLMGDFSNLPHLIAEWDAASNVINRRIARSVSRQIGRHYNELDHEIRKFLDANFEDVQFHHLAELARKFIHGERVDEILEDFETKNFRLAPHVKRKFPRYASVRVSIFGLKFEYPEHHFLRDIETAALQIKELSQLTRDFCIVESDLRDGKDQIGRIIGRQGLLRRTVVSAAYSLLESHLSGILFCANRWRRVENREVDEEFFRFAGTRDSAKLRDRLDVIVKFASRGQASTKDEPFSRIIKELKEFRDAIHHTTPFPRSNLPEYARLDQLYRIDDGIAADCVVTVCCAIVTISDWLTDGGGASEIRDRCQALLYEFTSIAAGVPNSRVSELGAGVPR